RAPTSAGTASRKPSARAPAQGGTGNSHRPALRGRAPPAHATKGARPSALGESTPACRTRQPDHPPLHCRERDARPVLGALVVAGAAAVGPAGRRAAAVRVPGRGGPSGGNGTEQGPAEGTTGPC